MSDWLPEHHEARFVVEIVEQLNLKPIERACGTSGGGALYAKRKSTVEPVFGIIKAILGFRQFSLLGLENVGGEFNLLAMAWNLKRVFALAG